MYRIKELKSILPISLVIKDRTYELRLLENRDLEEYIKNYQSNYFNQYMDIKSGLTMSYQEIQFKLINLIVSYKMNLCINGEARLVLVTKNDNTLVGGCTVFESGKNELELGYWVLSAFQNMGIAKGIINHIKYELLKLSNIKCIKLEIQSANIWSAKVAEDCNFKLREEKIGRYMTNKIYELKL